MATSKSYTDLEQSRKLAEFLPLESADMWYPDSENGNKIECGFDATRQQMYIDYKDGLPCWSLTALFELMPRIGVCAPVLVKCLLENKYYCHYMGIGSHKEVHTTAFYDQSIDAAYEMIIKLKERNLL